MSGLFGQSSTAATNTQGDISKDVEVPQPPTDSISEITFSPKGNYLAVSSWDNKIRIYGIDDNGRGEGKGAFELQGPALSVTWSPDGTKVIGGGADKTARMLDLNGNINQPTQVAAHDEAIKCVKMFEANGTPMLVTGSWDKTIKYWDLRASTAVGSVTCQDRIYSMDVKDQLLVVATAERFIDVINLKEPMKFYKTMTSPLKWQTRVVSCFNDATGFAVGSIEGRCAMQYVEEKDAGMNFSFKCHRIQGDGAERNVSKVFSVHDISWHPTYGTFSTAGSDGTFHFWDKDAKHRLKGYPDVGGPIVSTSFNYTGNIFAYGISYDWSRGFQAHSTTSPIKIMLHPVTGDECKPRGKTQKR